MAGVSVVVAVIAALTPLPALLAIVGPRINSLRIRTPPTDEQARDGLWARWAADIAKLPIVAGEDNTSSVISGLVTSARVITAAALIMVFVFGSFLLNGDPTIKQFGIGLAVAVILDATVVRCLLVPALMVLMVLMVLMGKLNWYIRAGSTASCHT